MVAMPASFGPGTIRIVLLSAETLTTIGLMPLAKVTIEARSVSALVRKKVPAGAVIVMVSPRLIAVLENVAGRVAGVASTWIVTVLPSADVTVNDDVVKVEAATMYRALAVPVGATATPSAL